MVAPIASISVPAAPLASVLDSHIYAARKATAVRTHVDTREIAQRDTPASIRSFAAKAAGMVYLERCLSLPTPTDVRLRNREPFPGTDKRHIKGATRKQKEAGMTA